MLRAREQDSCGICVHMCFPSYGKKEKKKKKRTLPVFDTQNCFFFFFFNSYWLTCGIYMSLTAIT